MGPTEAIFRGHPAASAVPDRLRFPQAHGLARYLVLCNLRTHELTAGRMRTLVLR